MLIGWVAAIIHRVGLFTAQYVETRPPQSNATRELVENTLPGNVSCPGASDVLHPTTRHPHLQRVGKRHTTVDRCAKDRVSFTCHCLQSGCYKLLTWCKRQETGK